MPLTILMMQGTLKAVWQLEPTIKSTFDYYRYSPITKFGDRTGCFKPEALLDFCEFIDNHENGNEI
jgi:hypothetical protein